MRSIRFLSLALLLAAPLAAQQPITDPFPEPIEATQGVIRVGFTEFAVLPDIDGIAARAMTLVDEPGTQRLFVSDMRGPIYSMGYDGSNVREYVNVNAPAFGVQVNSQGRERGIQSFAFHPQFNQAGTPGYGKFYTWVDTGNTTPVADFLPTEGESHHTVLLEWTAQNATASTFDGGAPRDVMRFRQPFPNHNGGHIAFNNTAAPGSPDFGLLYVSIGDGGSGGDPQNLSQNLANGFGKLFRIDPLGSNSANGKYGIPADNPFVADHEPNTLGEIYAYGIRNAQRFHWDSANGTMYLADIGQNIVEKVTTVTRGANLGWNTWEGSFRFVNREGVITQNARSDAGVLFPVQEYDQTDPLIQSQAAATGLVAYRGSAIPQLQNRVLWGDSPSGEIFHFDADNPPAGGFASVRRVLLSDGGTAKTFLQVIQEKAVAQGRNPVTRADVRINPGPNGRIFLTNKGDGVIRELVAGS